LIVWNSFPNKSFKTKSFNYLWISINSNIHCSYFIYFSHSKFLRCDKIMCFFYYMEAFYCGFLLDALFGLTWRMLTTCLTIKSCHKSLWSFGFWLVIPLYASVNDVLSLCMIMAVTALLVGRSQSFASLHFVLSTSSTRASNS
jgi:hypothetical protein